MRRHSFGSRAAVKVFGFYILLFFSFSVFANIGKVFAQQVSQSRGLASQMSERATIKNYKYGPHERNVFDFYPAQSDEPTPVAVYIHGGGFRNGSKDRINNKTLKALLDAGISVAAFNYRYVQQAPLPAAHYDCRRALQLLRSKATEWNIDKNRIGAFGGSAGAQICMYLAFHEDMARQTAMIQSNANLPDFRPWPHLAARPRWTLPGGRRIFLGTTSPIEIFIRH